MSDLSVSFTFSANTTIVSAQANTNFSDIVTYINNRDDGTATWDNLNVTATVANPVTIKSSASTTEVAIDNTATDGDPELTFKLSGVAKFAMGVDDSDSDNFIIAASGSLGSSNAISITSAGTTTVALGNFLVSRASSGGTVQSSLVNSSNTASATAVQLVQVAGTTAADPVVQFDVSGTTTWTMGIDNSVANDPFTISRSTGLGTTDIIQLFAGSTFVYNNLIVEYSTSGAQVSVQSINDSNTASSDAMLVTQVAGTSAGDAFGKFIITGGQTWSIGADNSASDAFVIANSATLGTTNVASFAASTGNLTTLGTIVSGGNIQGNKSASGAQVAVGAYNTSNTASSDALVYSEVGGTSGGDPFLSFFIDGSTTWSIGSDNSDSDKFKISRSSALGTSDIITASATTFDPVGTGAISSGDGSNYWNDISYKTLTDRGCLPWCDDGVELMDGSIVSDLEAIAQIQKHAEKQTIQGLPMLDYKTFPKKAYKQADNGGVLLERDEKGEAIGGHDGVEMTMMFGVMIGAFKEIKQRLDALEAA